jgi:hydrogenase expression/formation protein HypC
MCLAVPCKVITICENIAEIEHGKNLMSVDISLVPDVKTGEYVIVHAGMAIQIYDEKEALATLDLITQYLNSEGAS